MSKREDGEKLLAECTVYVTVEPCIMCAYALNLAKVKRVVFGTHNDKFGGNGSILSLHKFVKEDEKEERKVGYEVTKGVLAEDAVKILQSFYEHGNMKLPESKR